MPLKKHFFTQVSFALLTLAALVGVAQYAGLIGPLNLKNGLLRAGTDGERRYAADTLKSFCVDCHDPVLQTGGLILEPDTLSEIGAHAEIWEKVVHKLRAGTMPPLAEPRPEAAAYERIAAYLESSLDAVAAAAPNPGRLPQLHRLTRTEYKNAIRDLLALDNLPAEMDYELLLPADNASSGFDNIADLLFVSPVIMERYLEAARKISRLAVGDTRMPVMVNIHRLPLELPQDEPVDGLAFGTRGGLGIDSYFPLDAEYLFHVELARAAREPQEIEITIDGERVAAAEVGAAPGTRAPSRPLDFRVPVSAGPHKVGVTFVERTAALDESTVRVQRRSRGALPALELVTVSGPYDASGPGQTPSRERIFICAPEGLGMPENAAAEQVCAQNILRQLARRAYRRPATDTDVATLMPFFADGRDGATFDAGIQRALERLLVSPQFLYRIERVPEGVAPGQTFAIAPLELASRLSFFLWSSVPDKELLELAISGQLSEDSVLAAQVDRMLSDPRATALVTNFAAQWLFLRDVESKDPDLFVFRDYDESLRKAFIEETELFVASVLREQRSVLELITADYTYLNERLADHYGIPYIQGSHFRRVELPADSPRGGLLGQGSILTLTSYPTRTSPVLRGKYVLDNLLASPPPPPPADVPSLEADTPAEGATLTLRDAMARHRASPECASCHAEMDPIGFAFEHFDAVGRWRDLDGGLSIVTASTLPDGTEIDGIAGVKTLLLNSPERFVSAVTEKLLMYALGRNIQFYDRPAVRTIVREAAGQNYTFAALVHGIVKSVPFRMRTAPPAEPVRTTTAAVSTIEE
jgi:mono/diheme cytochrome c family protein